MPLELPAVASILKGSVELIKASNALLGDDDDRIIDKLVTHIRSIEAWSDQIQFLGMPKSLSSDFTVPLQINDTPRKFTVTGQKRSSFSEKDIIRQGCNFLILGDPGSGKTTVVKRLLRTILFEEPEPGAAECNFPMLIVSRELKQGWSIVQTIADELGLQYEYREFAPRPRRSAHLKSQASEQGDLSEGGYYYRGKRLENVIVDFLNDSKATLFVDGIDELSAEMRFAIEPELERLARGNGLKIVITCRSGDYGRRQIEGFDVVEIAPLDQVQIRELARKWSTKAAEFLTALDAAPYRDAADKPLFLTQLIQVYNTFSYLPPRPADVYQKIVRLSLDSWDRERRVFRKTQYAGFDNDRKLEFLSGLSFELTYHIKAKRFSSEQLKTAYENISDRFDLPSNEAEEVCAEIESHNGLIVKSYDLFEFSHLSLQEYLCAYHMVRLPFEPIMVEYLVHYPAPVAIAVSISAEPSLWFASLIHHARELGMREHKMSQRYIMTEQSAWSLINRLAIEAPIFTPSAWLGTAILDVLSVFTSDRWSEQDKNEAIIIRNLIAFLKLRGAIDSVNRALESYCFDLNRNFDEKRKTIVLDWVARSGERYSSRMPGKLLIPLPLIRILDREFGTEYQWLTAEGTLTPRRLEV